MKTSTLLQEFSLDKLNTYDLSCVAIDVLVELLDRAIREYNDKIFIEIDNACKKRTTEFNKDFGTNYWSIYQVLEHYKSLR